MDPNVNDLALTFNLDGHIKTYGQIYTLGDSTPFVLTQGLRILANQTGHKTRDPNLIGYASSIGLCVLPDWERNTITRYYE